jgi:hypothetical protein
MQPRDGFLKRMAWGALIGAAIGAFCILVGVIRGVVYLAKGRHIAPLSTDDIRLLVFYVVGFIAAGILISAIWPLLRGGFAQYFGFCLAGIVVMIGVLAGDKGGLASHETGDWIIAVFVGLFMGGAFAYGFRRAAS